MKRYFYIILFFLIFCLNYNIIAQSIEIVSPCRGDVISSNDSTIKIIWNIIDFKLMRTIDTVTLEISYDNGAKWEKLESVLAINDEISTIGNLYLWKKEKESSKISKLRIIDSKTKNILGSSKGNFVITDHIVKPMLVITYPDDSVIEFFNKEKINISWVYREIEDSAKVKIEYTTNYGKNWLEIAKDINIKDGNYIWEVPSEFSQLCRIRIVQNAHNIKELSSNFKISPKIPVGDMIKIGIGSTVGFNELRLNSLYTDLNFHKTFRKFSILGISLMPFIDFTFLYGKNALSDTNVYSNSESLQNISTTTKLISNRNKTISVLSMVFALSFAKPAIMRGVYLGIYSEYRQEGFKTITNNNGVSTSSDTSRYASFTGPIIYYLLEDNDIEFKISYSLGHDFGSKRKEKVLINGYNIRMGLRHKKYGIKIGAEISSEYGRNPNEDPRTFILYFAKDISITNLYDLIIK